MTARRGRWRRPWGGKWRGGATLAPSAPREGMVDRSERAQRVLRLVASDDEQAEAERILQVAHYRRAVWVAYQSAGFSPREALALVRAELGAPTIHVDRDDEVTSGT